MSFSYPCPNDPLGMGFLIFPKGVLDYEVFDNRMGMGKTLLAFITDRDMARAYRDNVEPIERALFDWGLVDMKLPINSVHFRVFPDGWGAKVGEKLKSGISKLYFIVGMAMLVAKSR